jgi:MFS family permease
VLDHTSPEAIANKKEESRIVRKIDLRLLPTLAVIYAFALIDRVNLPNVSHIPGILSEQTVTDIAQARIAGMDDDLGLSIGDRYSILTMVFFIPYIIFQFPANIVIRKLGPAVWLPSLVVAWGGVTVGMGFTTHWTQALGCRIILGVLEVSYVPLQGCETRLTST